MKIIFLDIDGVLNTHESLVAADKRAKGSNFTADGWIPECVERVKRIVAETGAKIVISSTWRFPAHIQDLRDGFERFNLPMWIDVTPCKISLSHRGAEIALWLEGRDDVDKYVIIDDDSDVNENQEPFFVETDWERGALTDELADKAIRILNQ